MVERLMEMCSLSGVSGDEKSVRDYIKNAIKDNVDEMSVDNMGNLVAIKRGKGNKKVMLSAHMDEVGFIITKINDSGMLGFGPVGGIDPRVLLGKKVKIGKEGINGVLGLKAIHLQSPDERKNLVSIKKMYIDIGATSKEQAEKLVSPGDFCCFANKPHMVGQDGLCAKAVDDRLGCLIMINLLEEFKNISFDFDLYCVFTVQEEVGCRGAKIVGNRIRPDYSIVLETTTCIDFDGVDEHLTPSRFGKGPAITLLDRGSYAHNDLVEALVKCAKDNDIKWQYKTSSAGGNDNAAFTRVGARVATISAPGRYLHTGVSMVNTNDCENMYSLIKTFLTDKDVAKQIVNS